MFKWIVLRKGTKPMRQNEIETINVENWKALQFVELKQRNKIQCPKCHYKYDSLYCIGKQIETALARVVTHWKCTNGHCLYEVEYVRSLAEDNRQLGLPIGRGNGEG